MRSWMPPSTGSKFVTCKRSLWNVGNYYQSRRRHIPHYSNINFKLFATTEHESRSTNPWDVIKMREGKLRCTLKYGNLLRSVRTFTDSTLKWNALPSYVQWMSEDASIKEKFSSISLHNPEPQSCIKVYLLVHISYWTYFPFQSSHHLTVTTERVTFWTTVIL